MDLDQSFRAGMLTVKARSKFGGACSGRLDLRVEAGKEQENGKERFYISGVAGSSGDSGDFGRDSCAGAIEGT